MIDFVNFNDVIGDMVVYLVDLIGGGVDYIFDVMGNVNVMWIVFELVYKGWGELIIIGVVFVGVEISICLF